MPSAWAVALCAAALLVGGVHGLSIEGCDSLCDTGTCDSTCTISTPHILPSGSSVDFTGSGSLSIINGGSLTCVDNTCTIVMDFSSGTVSFASASRTSLVIIASSLTVKSDTFTLTKATIYSGIISVTTTGPTELSCSNGVLNTTGSAVNFAYQPPDELVAAGASHAGSGSCGACAGTGFAMTPPPPYPSDPFSIANPDTDVSLQMGAQGGTCLGLVAFTGGPINGSLGGGVILLTAQISNVHLSTCSLFADGAPATDAGGGSGGSIILVGTNVIADSGTTASANGGGVQRVASPPKMTCGFPGGGGYIYSSSSSYASLSSGWARAYGGQYTSDGPGYFFCGGAGMLIDCPSVGEGSCDVTLDGNALCNTLNDNNLLPATPLDCSSTTNVCRNVTLAPSVNLALSSSSSPFTTTGNIVATSAVFTSTAATASLSVGGGISFSNVALMAALSPLSSTIVASGDFSWVNTAAGSIFPLPPTNSLALTSSSGSLNLSMSSLVITLASPSADTCVNPPLLPLPSTGADGTLYLSGSSVTLAGQFNAGYMFVASASDVNLAGATLTAVACAGNSGEGKGLVGPLVDNTFIYNSSDFFVDAAYNSSTFFVASGGSHIKSGGNASFSYSSAYAQAPAGSTYDGSSFASLGKAGSGGGGYGSVAGGAGGGTISLSGPHGTLHVSASSSLIAAGGSSNSYSGGGSGGSVFLEFINYTSTSKATLEVDVSGGSGSSGSATITTPTGDASFPTCGGGGAGGVSILVLPADDAGLTVNVAGGASPRPSASASPGVMEMCKKGEPGVATYSLLPSASPSNSGSSSASPSPSSSSSASYSASVLPSASPAATLVSPSSTPTPSITSSFTPSPTETITPTATPSQSGTPSVTNTDTPTPSMSPSSPPPPPIPPFGPLPTWAGYSLIGLGAVGFLTFCTVASVRYMRGPPAQMLVRQGPDGSLWSEGALERQSLLSASVAEQQNVNNAGGWGSGKPQHSNAGGFFGGGGRGGDYMPPSGVV